MTKPNLDMTVTATTGTKFLVARILNLAEMGFLVFIGFLLGFYISANIERDRSFTQTRNITVNVGNPSKIDFDLIEADNEPVVFYYRPENPLPDPAKE